MVIAEVFPEDSGIFICIASNKYGTVSSTAVLRVKGNFVLLLWNQLLDQLKTVHNEIKCIHITHIKFNPEQYFVCIDRTQ